MSGPASTAARGDVDPAFWRGRRVLLTGHTGFKGAWLALWLQAMGAEVSGLADAVPTAPSLFGLARVDEGLRDDRRGDVRDPEAISAAVSAARPEVVFHLAAQPMVRHSFAQPRETYEINVMGTVNVLEAVRVTGTETVRAVVVVTSDKCYDNREQRRAFVEDDCMGGHDPYSSSKGCAELVTDAYRRSFFSGADGPRLASGRAGNVIGGGDWGADRLVPDIVRATQAGEPVAVRNPESVRPWQHVLNPLSGYLLVAQALAGDDRDAAAAGWNFGPEATDVQSVGWITDRMADLWPGVLRRTRDDGAHPHEAQFLALDSTRARDRLGWRPRWDLEQALAAVVDWHVAHRQGADVREVSLEQIARFSSS